MFDIYIHIDSCKITKIEIFTNFLPYGLSSESEIKFSSSNLLFFYAIVYVYIFIYFYHKSTRRDQKRRIHVREVCHKLGGGTIFFQLTIELDRGGGGK